MALFQKPPPKRPESSGDVKRVPSGPLARPSARELASQAIGKGGERARNEPRDITVTGASLLGMAPSSSAIEVQAANPGLCAILENAALLFASGQTQPARTLLEQGVKTDNDAKQSPLAWLALFDLMQRMSDRTAFDQLAMQYVVEFERSAPAWDDAGKAQPGAKPTAGGFLAMSGKLTGASTAQLEGIRKAIDRNQDQARLDLSMITGFDETGAKLLAEVLAHARRRRFALRLERADKLRAAIEAMVKRGKDAGDGVWLLSLELMQGLHDQAAFEDRAIEYAIAFELSPPSWEPPPQVEIPPGEAADADDAKDAPAARGEALVWSGVLAGSNAPQLAQLNDFQQGRAVLPIDMKAVERIDFVCAGALANQITKIEAQRRAVQITGATPIIRAMLLLIGISPRHFVKKTN
jgi:ABC-type transporter Mla MlaB component